MKFQQEIIENLFKDKITNRIVNCATVKEELNKYQIIIN